MEEFYQEYADQDILYKSLDENNFNKSLMKKNNESSKHSDQIPYDDKFKIKKKKFNDINR